MFSFLTVRFRTDGPSDPYSEPDREYLTPVMRVAADRAILPYAEDFSYLIRSHALEIEKSDYRQGITEHCIVGFLYRACPTTISGAGLQINDGGF